MRMLQHIPVCLLIFLFFTADDAHGQSAAPLDQQLADIAALDTRLSKINLKDTDLRDVLRAVGSESSANILVDNAITQKVTLSLRDLDARDALLFLADEYDLHIEVSNGIVKVAPQPETFHQQPLDFAVTDGRLTAHLERAQLERVVDAVQSAGTSIIVRPGVAAEVSGHVTDVPLEQGLSLLFGNAGLTMEKDNGVYVIGASNSDSGLPRVLRVEPSGDSKVSVEASNVSLRQVLREIARVSGLPVQQFGIGDEVVESTELVDVDVASAIRILLHGSPYSVKESDGSLVVGRKDDYGVRTSELYRLQHARADQLLPLIPASVQQNVEILVVPELNGFMILGATEGIAQVINFVQPLDIPTPQILIEALVVDFETSELLQRGVTLLRGPGTDSTSWPRFFTFGNGADQSGGAIYQGDDKDGNDLLGSVADLLGVGVGKLPVDFAFRVQALEQEGKANVISRPKISTLSGHTARISIGTTQYYILTSTTPYQSPNQIVTQESERFEKIEANVSLEITPWVSAGGEVTVEVHPEFSTPVGGLNPGVPPTINSRILDSTVRLRDGETIILGGLIQNSTAVSHNKIPILGDIPLLGRLFRNSSADERKSELVIYITPHIFYGTEDGAKWNDVADDLDVTPAAGVAFDLDQIVVADSAKASVEVIE